MSPKKKSKSNRTCSRKNKMPKIETKCSPIKTRSKVRSEPRTPKTKIKTEPIPSASSTADISNTSLEGKKNPTREDILITPKVMKYCLNAYKQSPDYDDLKKKRFNTSFRYESPRGIRDIRIFTPEEENSPIWSENVPVIKNTIEGEPGEKYANIFMSIPGLSISDSDEDVKQVEVEETEKKCTGKKKKQGRKKSIGYKGVPLPDECLLTDYSSLFYSPSKELDMNKANSSTSSDV